MGGVKDNPSYEDVCTGRSGHLEVVKFLVSKGAKIHTMNNRALHEAAKGGYMNVVEFLRKL